MIKRIIHIIAVIFLAIPVKAQWASVNIDVETSAAIVGGYTAAALQETAIKEEIQKILKHYKSAAIATSGIYASKLLDRKALTNASRLTSPRENLYYKLIRNLVVSELLPRIVNTGTLCIKHPEEILTWGPFLYKCCEDVRQICMQFECVVTNGRISFDDVTFVEIAEEFKEIFDITGYLQYGDVDWQQLFDDMGNFSQELKKEDLLADLQGLAATGSSIATSGGQIGSDLIGNLSSGSGSNLNDKLQYIYQAYDRFKTLYDTARDPEQLRAIFKEKLDSAGTHSIFTTSAYDISSFRSNYVQTSSDTYYKQHYYIMKTDNRSNNTTVAYEEVFDSYTMDLSTFTHRLNALRDEMNETQYTEVEEQGNTLHQEAYPCHYTITSDDPIYYTVTDATRVQGSTSAVFLLYCENSTKLGQGTFSWKENGNHNHTDIRDDSKGYAMYSTLGEKPDVTALEEEVSRLNGIVEDYNTQYNALGARYNEVYYLINSDMSSDKEALYAEAASIEAERKKISEARSIIISQLNETERQLQQINSEYEDEEDSRYRIPAVMHELEGPYGINWTNDGQWQGSDFIRRGTIGTTNIVFRANLSCVRGESHFLGIRTHRAILQVDWSLTGDTSSSSETVGSIKFDNDMDDNQKSDLVNKKIHELNEEFPDCRVEVEYQVSEGIEEETTDELHLLWVSDRLQIARELYGRLLSINGKLMATQRYLHHREDILTRVKNLIFGGITQGYVNRYARVAKRRWDNVSNWIARGNKPEEFSFDESEYMDQ